ncbi:MAG TPA: isocitrate lyase/phosphoenolpyruvate mutase family protein [Candidatus Acidoferrales bacterium]|nr:isocitrate lyase/phosphoenolpyruvate mutase family protein [Candidatus Acidoferrales bacterium]
MSAANRKIARLDSRRDTEAIGWAKELRETEAWFQSPRFSHITRLHTPYEVVALRGETREDYTVAKAAATKMYDYLRRLFKEKKQEITYGPFSPTGAVRAVMEGIKVLYLGGWATSARGSDSEDPGADLANYALDRVPKEGASWVRALLHQDEIQRSNRMRMTPLQRKKSPPVEFAPPLIIPDGDTGHGGEHHVRNLVKKFVESKIGAIHIEDQRPGCKVCGHQGQKVLVSTAEMISRLNAARLQFDVMGVPGVIVARTDSNDATAIDSIDDERDHPFVLGATNPDIAPFKNVNLAVIRKFYRAGFKEINGHLLHRISENSYREAERWLKREHLARRVREGITRLRNEMALLKKSHRRARRQGKTLKNTRAELAARELGVRKLAEETLDNVLAEIRAAWAEKAGLKTYAAAVADAIRERLGHEGRPPLSVGQWEKFAAGVSHEEARARAREMGIDIFWSWDLPRTPDGFYQITGGREMAVARGLAMAPFADLLWRETAKPDLADDRLWADAIHAVFPDMMLAYNLSPSWNWDAWGFTDEQIRSFAAELGKMGYVFNFITYAGHQAEALTNGRLARALREEGVLGFVRLIQRALRLANDPAQYPQTFVGGPWADRFRRAARGPSLTTSSMGGKSTEAQHRKAVEVPTSVLEKWLRMWVEHWREQGLYKKGDLSVELKERWAGSEEMMLNVFDEARDKIAEIIFRVDKDRQGRKLLAVKDQNTVKQYRSRRLMTLMHFFLLHRYKTDLVHYVTPTDDNRLSVQRMIDYGVFRQSRTDDPNIIALEVNTARAQKIFASDASVRRFIAKPHGAAKPYVQNNQTKIRAA